MSDIAFAELQAQVERLPLFQIEILRDRLERIIESEAAEEDEQDLADARRVMAEIESGRQRLIPAEEVYRELGL